jgi:hypothetical protein
MSNEVAQSKSSSELLVSNLCATTKKEVQTQNVSIYLQNENQIKINKKRTTNFNWITVYSTMTSELLFNVNYPPIGKINNFPNLNNISSWTISINFYIKNFSKTNMALIGNMYNNIVPNNTGWGLWIKDRFLFWSWSKSSISLNNLGTLNINIEYNISIRLDGNTYTFELTNLINENVTTQIINKPDDNMITNIGYVSIGGFWNSSSYPKQVFLYKFDNNTNKINQESLDKQTYADKNKICASVGAIPATFEQLADAQKNGASWCDSGWISNDVKSFFPISGTSSINKCGFPSGINTLSSVPDKCDRKEKSYCILKDYTLNQNGTCLAPNGDHNYGNLNNYSDTKFVEWLNVLYDRNSGNDPSKGERVNVVDYVNRCKDDSNNLFLKDTKAAKLLDTHKVSGVNCYGPKIPFESNNNIGYFNSVDNIYNDPKNIRYSIKNATTLPIIEYTYSGKPYVFKRLNATKIKIECWGGSGGNCDKNSQSFGGYSVGYYDIYNKNDLYIYVGGAGKNASKSIQSIPGGWNGGGSGGNNNLSQTILMSGGGGGGATDVRTILSDWNQNLNSRLIVAGGGGGSSINNIGGNGGEIIKNNETSSIQQTKSWEVIWNETIGSLIFNVGNKQALNFNIRDTSSLVNSFDGVWGSEILITKDLHSLPRPLNLIITFNTAIGFTINYQGTDIVTLPNRFNVMNINDLKINNNNTKIIVKEIFFLLKDPQGIKDGKYKRIFNNTFGLNNNLNSWSITTMITSENYKGFWQSIIGNMRNDSLENGWGIWINPEGLIHFRIVDWIENLSELGTLINNISYLIVINFDNGNYKFNLSNLNNNTSKSMIIYNKPKLITTGGFITVGGYWSGSQSEPFLGKINYLYTINNLPTIASENILIKNNQLLLGIGEDGSLGGGGGGGGGWYGGFGGDVINQLKSAYKDAGEGGSNYIGGVTDGSTSLSKNIGNGKCIITILEVEKEAPLEILDGTINSIVVLNNNSIPKIDLGQKKTDELFSSGLILKRECFDSNTDAKTIYYKRIIQQKPNLTIPHNFSIYNTVIKNWSQINNQNNIDFNLYSSWEDIIYDKNVWSYCDYDNNNIGIGFPGNCGPYKENLNQWNTLTALPGGKKKIIYSVINYIDNIPLKINGLTGWYDGNSWDPVNNIWIDKSGNFNNTTSSDHIIKTNTAGYGSTDTTYIYGNSLSSIQIPQTVWKNITNYTIFHVTRYAGQNTNKIWTNDDNKWWSGFSNNSCSYYHNAYLIDSNGGLSNNITEFQNNWILTTDSNNTVRVYGDYLVYNSSNKFSPSTIGININKSIMGSDWACGEIIIYNRKLIDTEIIQIETYLLNKFNINNYNNKIINQRLIIQQENILRKKIHDELIEQELQKLLLSHKNLLFQKQEQLLIHEKQEQLLIHEKQEQLLNYQKQEQLLIHLQEELQEKQKKKYLQEQLLQEQLLQEQLLQEQLLQEQLLQEQLLQERTNNYVPKFNSDATIIVPTSASTSTPTSAPTSAPTSNLSLQVIIIIIVVIIFVGVFVFIIRNRMTNTNTSTSDSSSIN